ncbi:MAG: hypothetical protein L0Y75_07355, partial [Acidobacteria bacterium]|nr:hypothetical protein [Acidobacteriota bacterium]
MRCQRVMSRFGGVAFGAGFAADAATRAEIAGVSPARKKIATRLIFRVRISHSLLNQRSEGSLIYVRLLNAEKFVAA